MSTTKQPSRRARVLEATREVVAQLGRAVRVQDLMTYADWAGLRDLDSTMISRSVYSLAHSGQLVVIGKVRGGGTEGSKLYIPAELRSKRDQYLPTKPLTWLDQVASVFDAAWNEKLARTKVGSLVEPVAAADIRARIQATGEHASLRDPRVLTNALLALAGGPAPIIRKISGRCSLWAPTSVRDDELALSSTFGSDMDRIAEATRRAMLRTGMPAVPRGEILQEIRADPAIKLRPGAGFGNYLSRICSVDPEKRARRAYIRRSRSVVRISEVNRIPYFAAPGANPRVVQQAVSYVAWLRARAAWKQADLDGRLIRLASCRIPTIGIGRARLIAVEAAEILSQLNTLGDRKISGVDTNEVDTLIRNVNLAKERADAWLRFRAHQVPPEIPGNVDRTFQGWTIKEMYQFLVLINPAIRRVRNVYDLSRLLSKDVPRKIKTDHVASCDPNPRRSALLFFDQRDVLFYSIRRWGGQEARVALSLAADTLDRLRDARFVYPALGSPAFENRMAAAASLAFIPAEEGFARLATAVRTDPEPGVRQVALWAFGFAGGPNVAELLGEACSDPHELVRSFAQRALTSLQQPWLLL